MKIKYSQKNFVFGLRRTGQHGIINWLLPHYDSVCYLSDGVIGANNKNLEHPIEKYTFLKNGDKVEKLKEVESLFIDIQNWKTDYIKSDLSKENPHKLICFLIIRDPFNQLASIIKHMEKNRRGLAKTYARFAGMWSNYAEFYLKKESFGCPTFYINYNQWFSDINVRKQISKDIGKTFTDKGLNMVSADGRGSSFDDMDFCNKAQEMRVLERWIEFKGNEKFQKKIADEKLLKLAEKIYPSLTMEVRKELNK